MESDLNTIYWVVGTIVVANIGTIGAVLFAAAKVIWWIAKLDARVHTNTKDVNNAHKKIRENEISIREALREL